MGPLITADVTTDDKFIAGETYNLDLSDESLTGITLVFPMLMTPVAT